MIVFAVLLRLNLGAVVLLWLMDLRGQIRLIYRLCVVEQQEPKTLRSRQAPSRQPQPPRFKFGLGQGKILYVHHKTKHSWTMQIELQEWTHQAESCLQHGGSISA